MRPRNILIGLAVVVIVALVALSLADQLLVDYLWFGRLGFGGVFDTTVGAEIAIFAIVWLVAFVAIFVSGLVAIGASRNHERLRVVRRPDEMVEVNLPELIRALGERVPWRVIVAGGAALLALFAAQGEAAAGILTSRVSTGCRSESPIRHSATISASTSSRCRCSRKCAICS